MKTRFLFAVALAFAPLAWSADPAPAAQPPPITDEQIVAQFRSDLMAKRADIMAKGLTLTADEAAKFWPLFGTFQKEQDVIVNEQIKATEEYAKHYQELERQGRPRLRQCAARTRRQDACPAHQVAREIPDRTASKMAARAIQLDRRLGQVAQVQISQKIPLVR